MTQREDIRRAATALSQAEAMIIAAGAGMGVDSGLPDFRGNQGFWKAYPLYGEQNLDFAAMANPEWFAKDPAFAWGFYGHRLELYRATQPHNGFSLLRRWSQMMPGGAFIYTSNVDGQFQKAGYSPEQIVEIHGSIHHLQCLEGCGVGIVPAEGQSVEVDMQTLRAKEPLPKCPNCGGLARPNILMFGDWDWEEHRAHQQAKRLEAWLMKVQSRSMVVIECGAGTAIPSVRRFSEQMALKWGGTLVRINVREPEVPRGQIGLAMGAKEALEAIDREMLGIGG